MRLTYCPDRQEVRLLVTPDPEIDDDRLWVNMRFGPFDDVSEVMKEVVSVASYFLRDARGY